MKIAICDDDQPFLKIISRQITNYFSERDLAAELFCYQNAQTLLNAVKSRSIDFDIFFLDIEMPNKRGTTLSRELRQYDSGSTIVFVTAYSEEIHTAFHYRADAFISKRNLSERLPIELDHILTERSKASTPAPHLFEVELPGRRDQLVEYVIKVVLRDILFFESLNRKVVLHAVQEKYTLRKMNFESILSEFQTHGFLRTHRCYLVNSLHINAVGKEEARLDSGASVPISRRLYDGVIKQYYALVREGLC